MTTEHRNTAGNANPENRVAISVVVPSYRPAATVVELVRDLLRVLRPPNWYIGDCEILLIDDGNPPAAAALLQSAAALSPAVRVVRSAHRQGQQAATILGVAQARGNTIVTMDDDGAHPPSAVPGLVACLAAGYDLVYASLPVRRVGTLVNNLFFAVFLGKPITVPVGSFRAFRASVGRQALCCTNPYPYLSAMLLRTRPRVGRYRYRRVDNRCHNSGDDRCSSPSRYGVGRRLAGFLALAWYWGPIRAVLVPPCSRRRTNDHS